MARYGVEGLNKNAARLAWAIRKNIRPGKYVDGFGLDGAVTI